MAMAEMTIKKEPMDYEFIAPSETNESNGSAPQSKKSCSAVLQSNNNERNQPYSIFEQMSFKQEMSDEPSEFLQKEKSASNSCHDDFETSDSEHNDPQVFNILEEVEITIDNVKIEADNWTNEPSTSEKEKEAEQNNHLTKEEIDSPKNKFAGENDVLTPEDIEISIKAKKRKIEICNKENNWPQSLTAGPQLVPRGNVLEPKHVMYEFSERVEKHKLEIAEPDREKLVEKEKPKEENENLEMKRQTQTQSSSQTLLFHDFSDTCDLPEDGFEIIDLTSRDEKEENEKLEMKRRTQTPSSSQTLLFHDVLNSCDLPEDGSEIIYLTSRDEKGENERVQKKKQAQTQLSTHSLLFDDVLKLWGSPQDNNKISDFTSQYEGKDVDASQQSLICKDESAVVPVTCSSNFPTLAVKTPVRTYKRTAPKRQHPASWGEAENEEGKQKKITKSGMLLKSLLEKERNVIDLPNYNKNGEINVEEVKTVITAHRQSNPKGKNVQNYKDSTLRASLSSNVSVNLFYKLHSCFYCNQLISEIKQHLVEKHRNEEEVKMINELKSKAREKEFIFLTRVGDFKHNSRVLEEGNGLLIGLGGRFHDISTFDKDTFVSCPNCAGFVHINSLKHHHNSCLFKDITLPMTEQRNIFVESHAMLAYLQKQKFVNLTHYFYKRLNSTFGSIAKKDELIMLFIPYLYSNKKCQDSSAVLVLLQRLGFILQLYRRIVDDKNIKFHQILRPECVELLLKALQSFFSEVRETDRPGLYKSFYSHISVIAFIWRGKCLMDGNLKSAMEALKFFYHFTSTYKKKLNVDLVNRNQGDSGIGHSKTTSLSPANIISLKNSLNETVGQLTNALCDRVASTDTLKSVWHDLAEATMCLICLTNPVDFVAIEGIKLTEYAVRPDNAIDDLAKYKSMIPYRMLLEKHIFVCTEHLESEIVITLSATVKKAIDMLIKRRKEAGIPLTHPNIFSGCHDNALSAMNSFYNICIKQKGFLPEDVVRDLKKRRRISYIIDISEMSQDEVKLIKDYLKSSNDHKSSLQISPEDCYKSEIEKEFREALYTYEVSLGSNNNLTQEIKLLAPLDTVKCCKRKNEITRNNDVEDGSTQYKCEEIELLPPGTREKKDACAETSKKVKS